MKLQQTETFRVWRIGLKDEKTRSILASRLDRLAFGNSGDAKPVGAGISELRIDYGPGYRVYYTRHGRTILLLLCGGTKGSQAKDIGKAKRLAEEWRDDDG
jgi:putative addiction module killer protein